MQRCSWASNERLTRYHDTEWGVPRHDDPVLFEFLILEGAQAGLSWDTVLRKRDRYRQVFDGFNPERVARYDSRKIQALLDDPGIIRNRLKVASAVGNARAFLTIQAHFGTFDAYLWRFCAATAPAEPTGAEERVTRTPESDALSKDLMKRGFRFVGTTICYAYMQAIGMVNDHEKTCFRRAEIGGSVPVQNEAADGDEPPLVAR